MPRPRGVDPKTEQVLIRLTAAEQEILDSVAHLERVATAIPVREGGVKVADCVTASPAG